MPVYKYTGKNRESKTITGNISALNKEEVLDVLRRQDVVVISIDEVKKGLNLNFLTKKKIKLEDMAIFSRQLATMVEAGIPVVSALDALAQQMDNKSLQDIIGNVRDDVEGGSSLSQGLAKHPNVFSILYVNMVKAGESSGLLDEILNRLATYLEKINSLQRKIKTALVYPAVVITIAISITIFLLVKVVPTFKGIFELLGGALPMPTIILLMISDLIRRFLYLGILGFMLFLFLFTRYIKTERGRYSLDVFLLKLPVFGQLFRKYAIAKFSRTLSTLVRSGVPILTSLDIVGKTCGNKVLERAIEKAARAIKDGKSISEPLGESKVLPPMAVRMISVGEQTGELEKMLSKIADFYDEQVDAAVSALTSMIEPMVILVLGVVIGGIVLAIFLPIFKITELIGK